METHPKPLHLVDIPQSCRGFDNKSFYSLKIWLAFALPIVIEIGVYKK